MKERLEGFCPEYHQAPELYTLDDEEVLKARYKDLQLRDTSELRLDRLCAPVPGTLSAAKGAR
jgi:hypothetical protein